MTKQSFRTFCLQNNRADLLEQWDCERNPDVTPDGVTSGSRTRIRWSAARTTIGRPRFTQEQAVYTSVHTAQENVSGRVQTQPRVTRILLLNGIQEKWRFAPGSGSGWKS